MSWNTPFLYWCLLVITQCSSVNFVFKLLFFPQNNAIQQIIYENLLHKFLLYFIQKSQNAWSTPISFSFSFFFSLSLSSWKLSLDLFRDLPFLQNEKWYWSSFLAMVKGSVQLYKNLVRVKVFRSLFYGIFFFESSTFLYKFHSYPWKNLILTRLAYQTVFLISLLKLCVILCVDLGSILLNFCD